MTRNKECRKTNIAECREKYILTSESDDFVDMSSEFAGIRCRYQNVCGPCGSGKTTLLSALKCYFDDTIQAETLFADCEYGRKHEKLWEMNQHPVIFLDFSDFACSTFNSAVAYFRKKMSQLYLSMMDRCKKDLEYYSTCEKYIDIIEGISNQSELEKSLEAITHFFRRYTHHRDRALILIDEAGRPLLYAAHYGYLEEMKKFYDRYLEIDHYEMDFGIVTTSYAPANVDVQYHLKYIEDVPVNEFAPLRRICAKNGIDLKTDYQVRCGFCREYFDESCDLDACYDEMVKETGTEEVNDHLSIVLTEKIRKDLGRKRAWIEHCKKEEEEERKRKEEQSRREYAALLPENTKLPSAFRGIRELRMETKNTEKLCELNQVLRSLYNEFGPKIRQRDVYNEMQGIKGGNGFKIKYNLNDLTGEGKNGHIKITIQQDEYWIRVNGERDPKESGYDDLSLVKVYLSLTEEKSLPDIFRDIVEFLVSYGKHRFHAKASCVKRLDQICLWVATDDFFQLEKYVETFEDRLGCPLPFVAYRGKMGISREFYTWESHNGVQATLISTYLRTIRDENEIDVLAMYSRLVKAWNGDLEADDPFSKEFKTSDAQELLILLESLNVLLGNDEITDDHLLLSSDGNLWHELGKSKNWYEAGKNLEMQ